MPTDKVKVRFAPSPTGLLHVGNARTALLNYLFARKAGGQFILRIDDTDAARSTKEFEDAIYRDLGWLGLAHDMADRQANRLAKYSLAFYKLQASGHIYPAYETEAELERQRGLLKARRLPPIYNRAALDPATRAKWEAEGRKPHWRFKLSRTKIRWADLVRGPVEIDTATMSDPVLVREDGTYLYTLPSVIDDIDFGITHVIRGEDHVVNTAVQIEITEALGSKPPTYAHHSLLIGADGKGLSKRLGSLSIGSMREDGLEPMAVVSHAALLGTSDNIHPCAAYSELVDGFDLDKLSRAPSRFDEAELVHLNAKLLHHLPWDAVRNRLPGDSEAFWLAVRGNIERLSDAETWRTVVSEKITPVVAPEDAEFVATARMLLPPDPWDGTTWKTWTEAVKAATGRKGKPLFMPLRLALTGLDHGPELAQLLPLIGRETAVVRLG